MVKTKGKVHNILHRFNMYIHTVQSLNVIGSILFKLHITEGAPPKPDGQSWMSTRPAFTVSFTAGKNESKLCSLNQHNLKRWLFFFISGTTFGHSDRQEDECPNVLLQLKT